MAPTGTDALWKGSRAALWYSAGVWLPSPQLQVSVPQRALDELISGSNRSCDANWCGVAVADGILAEHMALPAVILR